MNVRRWSILAAAVTLSLGLSACGGGQTVAEGCKVADTTVGKATADFSELDPDASAEETSERLTMITSSIAKAEAEVENAEVKDAVGDLNAQIKKLEPLLAQGREAIANRDDEKKAEAKAALEDFQKDLDAAANRLDDLCKTT